MAATVAYFMQRLPDYSDPDPPITLNSLLLFCSYICLTFVFVLTWAVILSYVRMMILVMLLLAVMINLLAIFIGRILFRTCYKQSRLVFSHSLISLTPKNAS